MDVATLDNGDPYFVMELLEGTDVRKLLGERGRLPIPTAVDYVLQACEAVAEAHSKGIVHRDLKPSNLFLSPQSDGSQFLKVLDFGVSKVTSSLSNPALDNHSITDTGELLGSPKYMAPEQIRGTKGFEPRTDIWALGAILYELISGRAPFVGDTMAAVLASVAADAPRKLRELQSDVPVQLDSVVLRCLQKQVDLRFTSIAEFAAALSPFTDSGPEIAARIQRKFGSGVTTNSSLDKSAMPAHASAPSDPREATGTFRSVLGEQQIAEPRRRSRRVLGVAGAGVVIASALLWIGFGGHAAFGEQSAAVPSGNNVAPSAIRFEPASSAHAPAPQAPALVEVEKAPSLPSSQTPAQTAASVGVPAKPRPALQPKTSAPTRTSPSGGKKRLEPVFADGTLDRK
jgi:serine/threonine-protein kinase